MSNDLPQADTTQQDESTEEDHRGRRRALFIVITLFVVFGAAIAVYWFMHRNLVSTDDAFIQADVVHIAPRIPGTVTKVYVNDNDRVKEGQLLVQLDPTDYEAALAQAKANLASAKADHASSKSAMQLVKKTSAASIDHARAALASARAAASNAHTNLKRYKTLYAKDEIAQQRVDTARTQVKTADARVRQAQAGLTQAQAAPEKIAAKKAQSKAASARILQARAALKQAQLNLAYTKIRAPQAGKITQKAILPGSQVAASQSMFAIVANDPWVIANFKETQLTHMRPGQPVTMTVDAYPDHTFHGHVQSMQSGTGAAFSLLPPQNASGNFVKVVQRVPVKIVFDDLAHTGLMLAPGMSVEPSVNTAPGAADKNSHGHNPDNG